MLIQYDGIDRQERWLSQRIAPWTPVPTTCQLSVIIDRGRYLKVGGQTGVKTKAALGDGYRRGSPSPKTGVRGFNPRKIWKFYVQYGVFGGKIARGFDYKH